MTLKRRIAIYISLAFSLILILSTLTVYVLFASFRREEFRDRLEEKALTTARLLLEVKEVDKQLLKLIDQNTINKLYNEKVLVFDDQFRIVYSSIDDASINWKFDDLKKLKIKNKFFKTEQEKDVLGIFYDFEEADYYVLIAAEDKYGNRKLQYLRYTLLIICIIATSTVWLLSYQTIKYLLKPLDNFQTSISAISAQALNTRLPESEKRDEIAQLTKSFNRLLIRVDEAFRQQKDFSANASHELRTPISRLMVQLDNLMQQRGLDEKTFNYLKNMSRDINQMSDLINSLLLLAHHSETIAELPETVRIDEVIFSALHTVKQQSPQFQLNFEIIENKLSEINLEIKAHKSMLEVAFMNLLKNASQYASDNKALLRIVQITPAELRMEISNQGEPLNPNEIIQLFRPFMRGTNAQNTYGSGLGLHIIKRILDYHEATIHYIAPAPDTHLFRVTFKI